MNRFPALFVIALLVFSLGFSVEAMAACALRDAALEARKKADEAHAAYLKVKVDPALEAKMNTLLSKLGWLNDDVNIDEAVKERDAIFTKEELARLQPYAAAIKAREAADKEARKAEKAWYDEFKKKDEALTAAETKFAEEQAWLEEQKKDIVGKPVDDAVLTRTAVVVWRLQHSYAEMIASLEAYRECYPDARAFIEDLERRLARLKALEKEIADRRAILDKPPGDSGVTPPKPADPADPLATAKPGAATGLDPANDAKDLGAWWVCKGPETGSQGEGITVTAKGMTWTEKGEKGDGIGKVTITAAPPARIRAGQAFRVELTAENTSPALVLAGWYDNNYASGEQLSDTGSGASSPPDPNSNKKGPGNVAVLHRRFWPGNDTYPCWVEARACQPGNDYLPAGTITWRYEKE